MDKDRLCRNTHFEINESLETLIHMHVREQFFWAICQGQESNDYSYANAGVVGEICIIDQEQQETCTELD